MTEGTLHKLRAELATIMAAPPDGAPALKEVLDALPCCVSYCDASLRYRLCNQAYEHWFKRPRAEIIGRRIPEIIGFAAWRQSRTKVEEALAGRRVDWVADVRYPEGTKRVRVILIPDTSPDGFVPGFYGMVLEVGGGSTHEGQ